jgi:hypothetical protein
MEIKMKLRVCRASGMPVQIDHIEKFQSEYRTAYDKILDKFHTAQTKAIDAQLSQRMTRLLARVEKSLHRKYPNASEWDFMSDTESWSAKVTEYGPIALAQNRDTKELTYVILDVEF